MNVETSKFKNIKKVTGVILILVMLLLPFTSLLNVKAEPTKITVDSSVTKSDDPNSKKVTNTTSLTIGHGSDSQKAYKVLDIYYNETSNEMSYDFTSDFVNFKSSSFATTTTKDFSTLTINEYLAYGEEGANQDEFDLLAIQYSKYVRKNNIAGLESIKSQTNESDYIIENIEVGAYLVLATTNSLYTYKDIQAFHTYGAIIANVDFTAGSDGWYLNGHGVSAKVNENNAQAFLVDCEPSKIFETGGDAIFTDALFYKDKVYSYYVTLGNEQKHVTEDSSWTAVITLPEGLDYTDIYNVGNEESELYPVANNKIYNGDKVVGDISINGKTITVTAKTEDLEGGGLTLVIGVKLSANPVLGEAGNTIKTDATYVTNPYSDPAGTVTLTVENKVTTYGLQITNKSASDDTVLNGGVFGIYTDSTCSDSSKLGEVTVTNGVGKFEGVVGEVYVKQLKAPSGYKLSTDVAHVTIDTAALTTEGYYPLEVTNAKAGLLPSTGGLGTIIYTTFGLLVIVIGSIAFVSYRKKSQFN